MSFKYSCILTGGIATGKSTVCSILKKHGISIIDADTIAKEQLENSKKELKELFGESIFVGLVIDRKKLADIIFNSKEEREKLNKLIHPRVRIEMKRLAMEKEKLNIPYIVDIPLLFESGEYESDLNVVVYTSRKLQLKRLIQREGLSNEKAKKRVAAQIDIEKKRKKADWVIDNSSDLEHLRLQTEKFIKYYERRECK